MNRQGAKDAKGFSFFQVGTSDLKKSPCPSGRLPVQIVDHSFDAVLHQGNFPVEQEAKIIRPFFSMSIKIEPSRFQGKRMNREDAKDAKRGKFILFTDQDE
jgi:hypothetical protein